MAGGLAGGRPGGLLEGAYREAWLGPRIFVAVGKTHKEGRPNKAAEKKKRKRRGVERTGSEKKLIFKKFHLRMKKNQSTKLARSLVRGSLGLLASLINLQLRDEAALIAAVSKDV